MKNIRHVLSFRFLQHEIKGYGFTYSFRKYLLSMFLMLAVIGVTGFLYGLKRPYLFLTGGIALTFVPVIIRAQFRYMYEQKRFQDITIYLEQMAYSFQKHPKILSALKDIEKISEGKLNELIHKSILFIESGKSKDIYADALFLIENEYSCSRIRVLHKFLIKVEESGGNYQKYLNVLLMDFNRWTERTYLYQKDIKNIKRKSAIAVVMSFFIAALSVFLKNYCDITQEILYQLITVSFIIFCVIFYTFIQIKLNGSWLETGRTDKMVLQDYRRAIYGNVGRMVIKSLPLYSVLLIAAIISALLHCTVMMGVSLSLLILLPVVLILNKKKALKRTIAEIQNRFPEWLRDVALNLQFQTVQSSIRSSLVDCPAVLKHEVRMLSDKLERNPSAIEPYCEFLKGFHLLDITSNVKALYSISEADKKETADNISSLIDRNYKMIDKNAKLLKEDKANAANFVIYVPMILACLKLLLDMTVFISVFIQQMGNI